MEITFGPVPSRRLGRSLGINNIPPKHCSYSCLYCQVGRTRQQEIAPRAFYPPQEILRQVSARLEAIRGQGEGVDYLTFVPDGEPTLDANLADAIAALRSLGLPVAVISNASLIWRPDVRAALQQADWVSLKVDSVDESLWCRINRPHPALMLADVLDGICTFAKSYRGMLVSETMLLSGLNDSADHVKATAYFLQEAGLGRAYLSIPHRPPAERDVHLPDEASLARAYQMFCAAGLETELLTEYEGDAFAFSGDLVRDILAITAVHPLRESALRTLAGKSDTGMQQVAEMLSSGELKTVTYAGEIFYVRRLRHSDK